jgi:hypothetical protein
MRTAAEKAWRDPPPRHARRQHAEQHRLRIGQVGGEHGARTDHQPEQRRAREQIGRPPGQAGEFDPALQRQPCRAALQHRLQCGERARGARPGRIARSGRNRRLGREDPQSLREPPRLRAVARGPQQPQPLQQQHHGQEGRRHEQHEGQIEAEDHGQAPWSAGLGAGG